MNAGEFEIELKEILNWWKLNMIDEENGGFYGRVDGYGQLEGNADKGIILNTRILWTFAAAGRKTSEKLYEEITDRAFEYIQSKFLDKEKGGVYWMLNAQGEVIEAKKQIYAQAFAIYAFSEYYLLTQKEEAKELAYQLFDLIEQHSLDIDRKGYYEAFSKDWELLSDLRLSEKDANEAKTMNTHLHILEAYTNLYKLEEDAKVGRALKKMITLFLECFLDPESYHLRLFFDEDWVLKSDIVSFGHDIECSWLLVEAAKVLGDKNLLLQSQEAAIKIAKAVYQNGLDQHQAIFYERESENLDTDKHWWPQAEAVIGFWNAWQLSEDEKYQQTAINCWQFIQSNLKDRANGEWHWMVDQNGIPDLKEDKAGPWKAPYHNGRMCLEMMLRLGA